ncbi:uncharacterized protein MYCGRDRAFT_111251 [Zymoseptoria tritici IPO323]|uniref:Zn(2)-C6 fungal-type domain-containing protein n=1 Tax=Zymoseptoria tritici (strain CBS 115943 / IPO323) TaxID=336722 RepID=F9XN02_ZYMTI|nr:uncharacterized protein MYCGRDRAFT_111251 [Zymoseptoria tritici IPO323]EGP83601.1 hypothetical protein MYCGRDRAFT_111251 [Zymoseptoria tritici IPO323]
MSHRGQLHCMNTVSYHSHTMAPSAHSPATKLGHISRTASQDSTTDGIRKRVCKACDRCRLKKSKCDGSSPCSRCRTDNAICVFGERKKSNDKVYPKGYVEMLEQQQAQLVSGLQEIYRRMQAAGAWTGSTLSESDNGQPLTHDILKALGLLESKNDGSGDVEMFEEDPSQLQSRLISEGAGFAARRGSLSSESEHSQHEAYQSKRQSATYSSYDAKPQLFRDNFHFSGPNSPTEQQSPRSNPRLSQHQSQHSPVRTSSPLSHDPQLYHAEWAYPSQHAQQNTIQSTYMIQSPTTYEEPANEKMSNMPFGGWDPTSSYDMSMGGLPLYQHALSQGYLPKVHQDISLGMTPLDPMIDLEFSQFVQVSS